MKIFKFKISGRESHTIVTIQEVHTIIRLGLDCDGQECIWALVDENSPKINILIFNIWTGEEIPEAAEKYIGSIKGKTIINHFFSGEAK